MKSQCWNRPWLPWLRSLTGVYLMLLRLENSDPCRSLPLGGFYQQRLSRNTHQAMPSFHVLGIGICSWNVPSNLCLMRSRHGMSANIWTPKWQHVITVRYTVRGAYGHGHSKRLICRMVTSWYGRVMFWCDCTWICSWKISKCLNAVPYRSKLMELDSSGKSNNMNKRTNGFGRRSYSWKGHGLDSMYVFKHRQPPFWFSARNSMPKYHQIFTKNLRSMSDPQIHPGWTWWTSTYWSHRRSPSTPSSPKKPVGALSLSMLSAKMARAWPWNRPWRSYMSWLSPPLIHMKPSWDDYSQDMKNIFQTTNQMFYNLF